MNGTGEHVKHGSERKSHLFSHMWKVDQKDKCTLKCKHDHKHIHIENMVTKVGRLDGTWGRVRMIVNNIKIHCIYVQRCHNEMYWKLLNTKRWGGKDKGE
jgi:hypothetical protein